MDFLPVRASQIAGLLPPIGDAPHDQGQKRILFYRRSYGPAGHLAGSKKGSRWAWTTAPSTRVMTVTTA